MGDIIFCISQVKVRAGGSSECRMTFNVVVLARKCVRLLSRVFFPSEIIFNRPVPHARIFQLRLLKSTFKI